MVDAVERGGSNNHNPEWRQQERALYKVVPTEGRARQLEGSATRQDNPVPQAVGAEETTRAAATEVEVAPSGGQEGWNN